MTKKKESRIELLAEIEELRFRLEECKETLDAIRGGSIDALVISLPEGEQVFTLRGAEQPYRVLIESMNEGAAMLAPDGTIVYCNNRLAKMLQLPLEKLLGSNLGSYLDPKGYPVLAAHLENCPGPRDKEEISLITRSGNALPVLLSCSELPDNQGLSVVLTDISARKQTENTIMHLNRLYAVLSAINHAILHATESDYIFREFCRIAVELGDFRLAWVGLVDKQTGSVHVAAAHGVTAYLDSARIAVGSEPADAGPTGTAIREGTYYICNDFSENDITRPWQERPHAHGLFASASIAIKESDEVIGALTLYAGEKNFFDSQQVALLQQLGADVSFALDNISQADLRREAEQALREETIERLRTTEELRQKEQMLIQQNRLAALGEMIGNIAHQWRQPLNGLALLVQEVPLLYDMGAVDKEYLEANADKSMELIKHMSRTIDDFRNFFKPGKDKVDFKVREEIQKTLSLMEGNLDNKRINIEIDMKDDPMLHGYRNEYSQALLNILLNARDALVEKAVEEPVVTITICAENGRSVVTISDNAGGVPEEIIDKIFDPYFTTKGEQAGTGVGLFMSKTIIERNMGGRLTVRNTSKGAEFRIEV